MNNIPKISAHPRDPRLIAARQYLHEQGEALSNAVSLIAGPAAGRSVVALLAELQLATRLTRTAKNKLRYFHDVISLDFVPGDLDEGIDCSLQLDPDSFEVEQICLQADRLFELLQSFEESAEPHHAVAAAPPDQRAA